MLHRWLAVSALVLGTSLPTSGSTTWAATGDRYRAEGFSAEQVRLIDWALARFADAGFELPHLEFELYAQTEPCRGAPGFYTGDGSTIRICTPDTGPFGETLYLHEVAHAWDHHQLTDDRRSAFLELRHLETWWDDGSAPWHTFGAEHAAVIMMWGLIDRPVRVATIPDADCSALRAGYDLLTGRRPPHGFTDLCAVL